MKLLQSDSLLVGISSGIDEVGKGGPVLTEALAFLSCIVKQRLETPDHWILYAIVEQGKVADLDAKTAVHHRRVGSNY